MAGDMSVEFDDVGPLVGCSKYCCGGPSTIGGAGLSSAVEAVAPFLGLAGLSGGGWCCSGGLLPCWVGSAPDSMD